MLEATVFYPDAENEDSRKCSTREDKYRIAIESCFQSEKEEISLVATHLLRLRCADWRVEFKDN